MTLAPYGVGISGSGGWERATGNPEPKAWGEIPGPGEEMKIEIKHRFTGSVLFATETESWKLALEAAIRSGTNLWGADLMDADLRGADLRGANLWGADLRGAKLWGANLWGAYLMGSDLWGANLWGAILMDANLTGAKLWDDDLRGAKLIGDRPFFQLGPIGSRSDHLLAFLTDAGVYLRTGCWSGTVDQFRNALEQTHGKNRHAEEYAAALALVEKHAKLWVPKEEEKK